MIFIKLLIAAVSVASNINLQSQVVGSFSNSFYKVHIEPKFRFRSEKNESKPPQEPLQTEVAEIGGEKKSTETTETSQDPSLAKHDRNIEIKTSLLDNPTISDSYLEGYVQALIDEDFHKYKVKVIIRNKEAYLYNLPEEEGVKESIVSMVSQIPRVAGVHQGTHAKLPSRAERKYIVPRPQIKGIWFPQNTVLFPPLIANPRAVLNTIGYRWQWGQSTRYLGRTAVAVSFGDIFPLYRFIDIGKIHAKIQISLEAGAWPLFRIDHNEPHDWSEFVNADYFLGVPITGQIKQWFFSLRLYHISTHLGDELMVNNPDLLRVNPSYEGVDLFVAHQWSDNFRPYAGIGRVFRSDETFPLLPLYIEWGAEIRMLRRTVHYNRLYGQLFVAAHFKTWEAWHWALDSTVVAGYEWSKLRGAGRRFRIFMEWHNGFAPDGQFLFERLNYFGFRISYGF